MIQGFNIKTIDDEDIRNKRILLKVDFNILDLHDGRSLLSTSKVDASIPTMKYLLDRGNRLICTSHVSKTKARDPKRSLKPVAYYVQTLFPQHKIVFVNNFQDSVDREIIHNQKDNEIIILENILYYPEEELNDQKFVEQLCGLADIFVYDAFPEGHRPFASVIGPQKHLPSFAGFAMKKEVEAIMEIVARPTYPLTVVMGGAKVSTKIPVIETFLDKADYLVLGGVLANTFLVAQGYKIGKSVYEFDQLEVARGFLDKATSRKAKLILPTDAVVGNIDNETVQPEVKNIQSIPDDRAILDIGPQTVLTLQNVILQSKTIFWNGPLGFFEKQQYRVGTDAVFEVMSKNREATTIIGGGDTLTAIENKPGKETIDHISNGGGAMLYFIEKGTLPALEAFKV